MTTSVQCAIICNDPDPRSTILATALSQISNISTIYRWQNKEWRIWSDNQWQLINNTPDQVDLVFCHASNSVIDNQPIGVSYQKIAKFDVPGQPKVAQGECSICRPFPHDSCPLEVQHIKELIDWAKGNRQELPTICQPSISTLLALSILCQGYLAEHGQLKGLDTIQDASIQQKLKALKESEKKETEKPSWWRKPFGSNKPDIKAECGDQKIDKIEDLINAIYSNESDQLIKLEVVQNAYNQINKILPKFT